MAPDGAVAHWRLTTSWIEDCLLVLQCVAQLNSMLIACVSPREFPLFWRHKTSLTNGEALPPSVPLHVRSRVRPKMSRRYVTIKKWKNQAFVGNVGEFHDAMDFPGSEGLDGIEVGFLPVELDERWRNCTLMLTVPTRQPAVSRGVKVEGTFALCQSRSYVALCSSTSQTEQHLIANGFAVVCRVRK